MDKAVQELAGYVKLNAPKYAKTQERNLKRKINVPEIKKVRTSVVKPTEELQAALTELQTDVAGLQAEKAEAEADLEAKRARKAALAEQVTEAETLSVTLQAELDALQGGGE
jgi:chromosome segregation ATPase